VIDFRRCQECGAHHPADADSCPACGRFVMRTRDLAQGRALVVHGGLPVLAALFAILAPSPWGPVVVGAGFAPLLVALAWLAWRRQRRSPRSFKRRIEAIEVRLAQVQRDLRQTESRLVAAALDREAERRPRAAAMLDRELAQDRRLRGAQRRLVAQLERRLEHLEIERFRDALRYYEACRDARVESPLLAKELGRRIRAAEAQRPERSEAWDRALEEARLLQRQISRGVQRLHAALRLDPLAHAELAALEDDDGMVEGDGELDEQVDQQLERIERGFAALEELTAELAGELEGSGVRVRVDDGVLAALDEASQSARGRRERVSVEV
jgi:ribosomal protein L40E